MLPLVVFLVIVLSGNAFRLMGKLGGMRPLAMSVKEGDRVPSVTFKARVRDETLPGPNPFKWKDVGSSDLFAGKRCVLFALPGGESLNPTLSHC